MWCIGLSLCFIFINFSSSLPTKNQLNHYRQIRSSQSIDHHNRIGLNTSSISNEHGSSDSCSMPSINIDKLTNGNNSDPNIDHSTPSTMTTIDIIHFISTWQRTTQKDDSGDNDDHSTAVNAIQIIFTIPYTISNESILNKTLFITDVMHNQLLASLTNMCINGSSFSITYSTVQPLPHNICLYLLLNLTSSTSLREIIFCRTIENSYANTSSSQGDQAGSAHSVGPSEFFILSQCIIILMMMLIIYGVQTARQKSLINRVGQRLIHSRPYMTVFGNKTTDISAVSNTPINAATTLQAGLNQLAFRRHLSSLPILQITPPIEEQVLAANDLTSTIYDRRVSRPCINRDLIDVKEFTKRISISNESSKDRELHPLNNI